MARRTETSTTVPDPVPTIAGGFLRVEVAQLHRAWHACRARGGGSTDFRAWLAALEMRARRGGSGREVAPPPPLARDARGRGRRPNFQVAELAQLCAIGERRAAAAIRNLGQLGLLTWDPAGHSITFPAAPVRADQPVEGANETPLDDSLPGRSGVAALPRRVARFLASGAKPALIAATLGVLLRCVSRRRAGWTARGRVKASWIAEVFAVDARRVKAARAELIRLGWLRAAGGSDPQWAWNRWGRAFVVDLAWRNPARPVTTETARRSAPRRPRPSAASAPDGPPASGADCHPIPPSGGPELSPPDLHPDPVPEKKNPDPGSARPAGVDVHHRRNESIDRAAEHSQTTSDGPNEKSVAVASRRTSASAGLNRIELEDLANLDRTLGLYAAAVRAGWVGSAEADRLRFVAAAAHARGVGASNPPGLFRAIVQGRRWHLITQADEDRARAGLRIHDRDGGVASPVAGRSSRPTRAGQLDANPLQDLLDRFAPRLAGLGAAPLATPCPDLDFRRAVS